MFNYDFNYRTLRRLKELALKTNKESIVAINYTDGVDCLLIDIPCSILLRCECAKDSIAINLNCKKYFIKNMEELYVLNNEVSSSYNYYFLMMLKIINVSWE